MKIAWSAVGVLLVCASATLGAAQNQPSSATQPPLSSSTTPGAASSLPSQSSAPITEYRLPPELHTKAHSRNRIHFRLNLIGAIYGIVVLLLILQWKLAPRFRNWSERIASRRFLQSAVFSPLLLLTLAILTLPLDIYGESVEKRYGISVQGWGSWSWDWIKGQLISFVLGTILIWLLYLVIRRSPRRWWFYFWLISLPIGAFLVFLQPLVIDPMFHKFEPLQQKDPALVANLEKMVQRAGQNIPPERMFWMGAGEKTTSLNAYVTGMGASKRIVVWDNTIADMTTPEIVYVAGHETGHYVLKHIQKGLLFFAVLLLIAFYLGYRTVGWMLARFGGRWDIRGLEDWASLPVLLLLLSIFSFIVSPIASAFSRHPGGSVWPRSDSWTDARSESSGRARVPGPWGSRFIRSRPESRRRLPVLRPSSGFGPRPFLRDLQPVDGRRAWRVSQMSGEYSPGVAVEGTKLSSGHCSSQELTPRRRLAPVTAASRRAAIASNPGVGPAHRS